MSGHGKRQRTDDSVPAPPVELCGKVLDPASPADFYLPGSHMLDFCDCELVVQGGHKLPVSRSHLAAVSHVLAGALAGQAAGDGAGSSRVQLASPFSDFGLEEVALFLRLGVYAPKECTAANLAAVGGHLPALLHLAHQLDAGQLMEVVLAQGLDSEACSVDTLVSLINAADTCRLEAQVQSYIGMLARKLRAAGALHSADELVPLRKLSRDCVPAVVAGLCAAGQDPGLLADHIWEVKRFSETGGKVSSVFEACGMRWRLRLYPKGFNYGRASYKPGTFISVYISCLSEEVQPVLARVTLLHDDIEYEDIRTAVVRQSGVDYGWEEYIRVKALRKHGYLNNDTLRIAAQIQLI